MRELVRLGLPVETETPWGLRRVRPPSVREALGVLTCAEAATRGDPDAWYGLKESLRTWLPLGLYSLFVCKAYPRADAVRWAVRAIKASAPDPEALVSSREREDGDKPTWEDVDWAGKVADYAHAYGMSPGEVLTIPFPAFTLFLRGVERVHAREDLRGLWVQGLPYQDDDRKRRDALRRKQEAAGYPSSSDENAFEDLTEEEALEKQREALARMNRRMGRS